MPAARSSAPCLVLLAALTGCAHEAAGPGGSAGAARASPPAAEAPAGPSGTHALRGVVRDAAGGALGDAEVTLSALGPLSCMAAGLSPDLYLNLRDTIPFEGEPPVFQRRTRTDREGRFSFEALPNVLFGLVVAKGPAASREQVVKLAEEEGGLEIRLEAPVTTRVEVVDEEGRPVPGAALTVGLASHPARSLKADAAGLLELESSPPVMVHVRAEAPGLTQALGVARPGDLLRLELFRPRQVSGRVLRDGAPLAGATVEHSAEGVEPAETDERGRFRLEGLPGGPVKLRAAHANRHSEVVELDLRAGGQADVTLTLQPGAVVELTVNDADGKPFSGAEVSLQPTGVGVPPATRARTDAQGRAVFEDVFLAGMGIVVLEATAPGHARASSNLGGLRPGKRSELTLVLRPAHAVQLALEWKGPGAPPEQKVTVRLTGVGDGAKWHEQHEAEASPGDEVRLQGVPPGRYLAQVRPPWTADRVTVRVPGEAVRLPFQLGRAVRGRVVDEHGEGVSGFAVEGTDPSAPRVDGPNPTRTGRAFTDKHGHFELRGLGHGVWELEVSRVLPNVGIGQKQTLPAGATEVTIRVRRVDYDPDGRPQPAPGGAAAPRRGR